MKCISENPYRILGLPVTASCREIEKRISDLKIYAEMKKSKSLEWDLPIFTPVERTLEQITTASNDIEQADGKLYHSLYWFWDGNHIDEMAFDILRKGKVEKAIEILFKSIKNHPINENNWSNYKNLSLLYLYLSLSTNNGNLQYDCFSKGIEFTRCWLVHPSFLNLSSTITGKDFSHRKTEIYTWFTDQLMEESKKHFDNENGISQIEFLEFFENYPDEISSLIYERLTKEPREKIINLVNECAKWREREPEESDDNGEELYVEAEDTLNLLRECLGEDHYQYQTLANKVAEEISSCSIAYYNSMIETNPNIIDRAIEIAEFAYEYAESVPLRQRIQDGISTLTNNKKLQQSTKHVKIFGELLSYFDPDRTTQELIYLIEEFFVEIPDYSTYLGNNARSLRGVGFHRLTKLKSQMQDNLTIYHDISETFARIFLNISIAYVNNTQQFSKVFRILNNISRMDMSAETRKHLKENQSILEWNSQMSKSRQSSGCFIATAVYGNINAPEVVTLRNFRDTHLAHYTMGRLLIYFYYQVSPWIAKQINRIPQIKPFIRIILDHVVKRVNK